MMLKKIADFIGLLSFVPNVMKICNEKNKQVKNRILKLLYLWFSEKQKYANKEFGNK